MRYRKRAAAVLLIILCITGCDEQAKTAQGLEPDQGSPAPLAVSTAFLKPAELAEPIFVTGTVLAPRSTGITPLAGGRIDEI